MDGRYIVHSLILGVAIHRVDEFHGLVIVPDVLYRSGVSEEDYVADIFVKTCETFPRETDGTVSAEHTEGQ